MSLALGSRLAALGPHAHIQLSTSSLPFRAVPVVHLETRPSFSTSTRAGQIAGHSASNSHPPKPPARSDHSLVLPDNRHLSYATYGPAQGFTVFFLHGLPSCRLEAAGIASTGILDQVGVRLVVPDRPGFGQSSLARGRTIASYSEDLEALALHLALESTNKEADQGVIGRTGYSIVGGSGGGPFALACAHAASTKPHRFTNMLKVGVFAGAPPYVPPTSTYPAATVFQDRRAVQRDWMITSRLVFGMAKHLPLLSQSLSAAMVQLSSWLYRTSWGHRRILRSVRAWLAKVAAKNAGVDNQALAGQTLPPANDVRPSPTSHSLDSQVTTATNAAKLGADHEEPRDTEAIMERETSAFITLAQETWAQGSNGWLDEVRLLGNPWDFDPSEIRCRKVDSKRVVPVKVWHGSEDANAPLISMRWLVDRIPGAELTVLEDKDHFGLGGSLQEMLEWSTSKT